MDNQPQEMEHSELSTKAFGPLAAPILCLPAATGGAFASLFASHNDFGEHVEDE